MSEQKLKLKNKVLDVEMVIIQEGKNLHVKVPFGKKYEIGEVVFEPKRENLFLVERFARKSYYMAIFNEKGEPIERKNEMMSIKDKDGKELRKVEITAKTLQIANNSQSLKNGLSELFSDPANKNKLLLIMALGVVGVVIYMIMSGAVTL